MHLQQTKVESRATGGPQYYFQDVAPAVKDFLRRRGVCPVVLRTPYGIAASPFVAVGKDHKLAGSGRAVRGKVGHDRVQAANGEESIGEAIRRWYGLPRGCDFERIDVEAAIHPKGHFILTPTAVLMRKASRPRTLETFDRPLTFHRDHQSGLWKRQIDACRKVAAEDVSWAATRIARVVQDHREVDATNVHEADLLRAAGALSFLGLEFSPYLVKGYDCPGSRFCFTGLPPYPCPVELKKHSSGFDYQMTRYFDLPRAVVLCVEHDLVNAPEHVDVVELSTLAKFLGG